MRAVLLFLSLIGWNWEEMDRELMEFPSEFCWTTPPECSGYPKNAERILFDWSMIEPEEGVFNDEIFKGISIKDVKTMAVLHGGELPTWFQARGGFEKEENIECFTRYSKHVFSHFKDEVELWCTLHEPNVDVLMRYLTGLKPPHKKDLAKGGAVLKNMMKAHSEVYRELKVLPGGEKASIGMSHCYLTFEAYRSWNPLETIPATIYNNNLHVAIMKFFREGAFEYYTTLSTFLTYHDQNAPKSFDFFALSYAPRGYLSSSSPLSKKLKLAEDDFGGEGFYVAMRECARLGKPIYITGIGKGIDEERALFVISEAILHGIPVRGYFRI